MAETITGIWGTWEELVLVSAVKRHGTKNWDSIAIELQNRITSSSSLSLTSLTPNICKQKYHELRRRFMSSSSDIIITNQSIQDDDNDEEEDDVDSESMNPWVEELRKLRVAELKKELQKYDVSIVSLQLKVKKLKEEKEKSSDESGKESGKSPDLELVVEVTTGDETQSPAAVEEVEKSISGEDSDRENQSFNESNSTDPGKQHKSDELNTITTTVSATVAGERDPVTSATPVAAVVTVAAAVEEGSYNGSSETIAKDSVNQPLKETEPSLKNDPGESPELWESAAESKEVVEGTKESSDVQSSASLSKENTHRKKDVSGCSSGGEEPETDEISPAIKGRRRDVKSHPFKNILEIIKSHKYGYVFEKRIRSQDSARYRSAVREHIDLETINRRLRAGKYSGSRSKFFRDLLLLITNAIVFFPSTSSEFTAAVELRQLVSNEMGLRSRKTVKSTETQAPVTAIAPPPEHLQSLLAKPKTTLPVIASRKRSSITKGNKAVAAEKKETVGVEEKKTSVVDRKPDNGVASLLDDQMIIKKGKRDRPSSGPRSSRTGKAPTNMNLTKPSPTVEDEDLEKTEKEKQGNVNTVAKKRSVANFLNRMKTPPPSSSSNGTLLDSLKNSEIAPSNVEVNNADQKKRNGGRGSGTTKQSLSKRSSPAKRSVGRPPKQNPSSPITPPPPPKRSRDTNETEAAASKQPRKRAKR